ncbi:hypothetical protein V5O48_003825 [Marasmius crinis-equi]|uniref:Uncharacterized protein n=1 Tax=Marasmius crinis-equi TaxID=585013 RepID=A0ABR3FRU2_9AGAR
MAGPDGVLRPEALLSLITSPLIILTTVHAQDFSDIEGDRALGRSTLPVSFPALSKLLVCTGVPIWTGILLSLWRLPTLPAVGLVLLAFTIAYRFHIAQTSKEYSSSYITYNLWLLAVHTLPSIGHLAT